jgi:hypothetical protein
MNKFYRTLTYFGILLSLPLASQSILNGSFENTTADTCDYNLIDADFNKKMKDVTAFGKAYTGFNGFAGEIDLHTLNCIVNPQQGDWCIGMSSGSQSPSDADAIAFKLSAPLQAGMQYRVSFYTFGSSNPPREVEIGYSVVDTAFGAFAGTAMPLALAWTLSEVTFKPSIPAKFLTLRIKPGANGWTQVDHFSIEPLTGTKDTGSENDLSIYPNPFGERLTISSEAGIEAVRLFDALGRLVGAPFFSSGNKVELDVASLPAGAYCFVVTTRRGDFSKVLFKR